MVSFEPREASDRLLRMVEVLVAPERRSGQSGGVQVGCVFGVGDLSGGELKCIDPDAVDWAFAILAVRRPHEEPCGGDGNQARFNIKCGLIVRMGGGHCLS